MKKKLIGILLLIVLLVSLSVAYILPYIKDYYLLSESQFFLFIIVIIAIVSIILSVSFDLIFSLTLDGFLKNIKKIWVQDKTLDSININLLPIELRSIFETITSITKDDSLKIKELESQQGYTDEYYRLISTVSHQLRTPVTGLSWALSSLQSDMVNGGKPNTELLSAAIESASRVGTIIEELLIGINGDKNNKKVFEAVDLEKSLNDVIKESSLLALEHKMKISIVKTSKLVPLVKAVPYEVAFVFHSLITNAITYGKQASEIVITLGHDGEYSTVNIHNEGTVISEPEKAMLFSQFNRGADAIKINPNGSGLGLYLVKKIMLNHSGTVTLDSSDKAGTSFSLKFPISNKGQLETFINY